MQSKRNTSISLCLSGTGYRAMLFQAGSLLRLNELGLLRKINRLTSVSAASITTGVLAAHWQTLAFDATGVSTNLSEVLVPPLRTLSSTSPSRTLLGPLLRTSPGAFLSKRYSQVLFGSRTLREIPDRPSFRFVAKNLLSGQPWCFTKYSSGDAQVGHILGDELHISDVVVASSAPQVFPLRMDLRGFRWKPSRNHVDSNLRTSALLCENEVLDALTVKRVLNKSTVVLVSDGGSLLPSKAADPCSAELRRALHKGSHVGAHWGLTSGVNVFQVAGALTCRTAVVSRVLDLRSGYETVSEYAQDLLIDWGYAITDAAVRRFVPWLGNSGESPFHSPNDLFRFSPTARFKGAAA